MTFEEISYLVALRALLVDEVSRKRIVQAKKEEQDYYNQQFSKFTVIAYRLYHVITTRLACFETAEAKRKMEKAKISRGEAKWRPWWT